MTESADPFADEKERYILFDVGSTRLATPLLSVREIVEPIPYKRVSNPCEAFLGLANLRGQIIGVIDFGLCLRMQGVESSDGSKMIVFDGEDTKMGVLVSSVHSPILIQTDDIIREVLTEAHIPPEALLGIAKIKQGIIPIVSLPVLSKTLSSLRSA